MAKDASSRKAQIAQLRERYRPDPVQLLFVAESPPESEEGRFFYNADLTRGDHLFRALMEVAFDDFDPHSASKGAWLERFRDAGCYLIDLTDEPVNRLPKEARRRALVAALPGTLTEIRALASPETPIVLVKKNVFELLHEPLRAAGLNVVHDQGLPFPANGWQPRFVTGARAALGRR